MNQNHNQKYALVTGSSSGLGRELISSLLAEEMVVFGVSLDGLNLDHENYTDILCDLTDEEAVEELFQIISEKTSSLHHIVHLAGLFQMAPFLDHSKEENLNLLKTNVLGVMNLFKHTFSYLVEDETHLILFTNPASISGLSNLSSYGATQAAVLNLFESLKEEWGHLNIRFSSLIVDPIDSTLWEELEIEVPREKMFTIDEVVSILMMVVAAPNTMEFPRFQIKNIRNRVSEPILE